MKSKRLIVAIAILSLVLALPVAAWPPEDCGQAARNFCEPQLWSCLYGLCSHYNQADDCWAACFDGYDWCVEEYCWQQYAKPTSHQHCTKEGFCFTVPDDRK